MVDVPPDDDLILSEDSSVPLEYAEYRLDSDSTGETSPGAGLKALFPPTGRLGMLIGAGPAALAGGSGGNGEFRNLPAIVAAIVGVVDDGDDIGDVICVRGVLEEPSLGGIAGGREARESFLTGRGFILTILCWKDGGAGSSLEKSERLVLGTIKVDVSIVIVLSGDGNGEEAFLVVGWAVVCITQYHKSNVVL